MTPDKGIEIFTTATAAHESVTIKPAFTDINRFDEQVNSILVEIPREHDGDECGMLYLSQDPSEYSALTGSSTLTKIRALSVCDNSIDSSASDAEHKSRSAMEGQAKG